MTDHAFKPILLDLLQQTWRDEKAFWQELNPADPDVLCSNWCE